MSVSLTHTTAASGTDSADGKISKNAWNEAHTLSMATEKSLGRVTSGSGAVEELDLGLASGYTGTSEPSAPAGERVTLFAKDFNGWPIPWSRGASYRSGALFPLLTGRPQFGIMQAAPGTASPVSLGLTVSAANAVSIAPSNTNAFTRFARTNLQTTGTGSTSAGVRDANANLYLRGTNALDGLRCRFVFGLETVGNTNCRWFVGLLASSGNQAASFDPSTATNLIGIGATGTDTTNAKIYNNDGSGSAVAADLGGNYPAKTAAGGVFELILWAEASASTVKYHIRRLDDLTIAPTTGSLSSDIPAAGTAMFPHFHINNNATATNSVLAMMSYMVETGIG